MTEALTFLEIFGRLRPRMLSTPCYSCAFGTNNDHVQGLPVCGHPMAEPNRDGAYYGLLQACRDGPNGSAHWYVPTPRILHELENLNG